MRDEKTAPVALDALVGEFEANGSGGAERTVPVTFWISVKHKEAYDTVQARTGRKLSKRIRAIIQAAIELAEKRAS
jgi:hypothetical protein